MSAKTLRRDKCAHDIVEFSAGGRAYSHYCQRCGARFPLPKDRPPRGYITEDDVAIGAGFMHDPREDRRG